MGSKTKARPSSEQPKSDRLYLRQLRQLLDALESESATETEEILWKAFSDTGLFRPMGAAHELPWRERNRIREEGITEKQTKILLSVFADRLLCDRYLPDVKAPKPAPGQTKLF